MKHTSCCDLSDGTRLVSTWTMALLFCLFWGWAGAAQSEFQFRENAKLEDYQKVYLTPIKNDKSKVYDRVLLRLKKCGFEADEVKNLPFASQGSGFLLDSEGDVLTCAHVVGKEPEATLWIGGVRYWGRVTCVDTNLDAAVVRVKGNHPPYAPLYFASETACRLGVEVYDMGFPLADILGTNPRINKGLISSMTGMHGDTNYVQVSAEVQPGNSGGPLLSPQAEVVGMITATINPMRVLAQTGGDLPQNLNFALRSGPLLQFLAKAGLSLPARTTNAPAASFEEAGKSLALIRGGIVDDARLQEKPLLCMCTYIVSTKEFLRLRLGFIDVKNLRIAFIADQVRSTGRSMDSDLDHMFKEICARSIPSRPNPFDNKKKRK